jgi:lincosamide nucleotidyltransferase
VLARHVAARGEYLRAWDALGHIQRHLLWMARLAEHRAVHLIPCEDAPAFSPGRNRIPHRFSLPGQRI